MPLIPKLTPMFPAWRTRFAACKRKFKSVRQMTLSQLELLFAGLWPDFLLSQADEGTNSRDRVLSG